MKVTIHCADISEAITLLQNEVEDGLLDDLIQEAEEGEIIYMPFGEIEV